MPRIQGPSEGKGLTVFQVESGAPSDLTSEDFTIMELTKRSDDDMDRRLKEQNQCSQELRENQGYQFEELR